MTFDELVELESELDRKQSREKDEAAFDRMNQVRDELNRRVEPDEADAPAVHGSARDLARFKASLSERTDSELFKLQIQCGKEGSDNSYYEAVLDERLRREDSSAEVSPDEAIAATVVVLATPDRNTIEGGLYAALHHFSDASERWQYLRETGATDAQLKKAISYELGHGGGQSGPGLKPISFKGDKEPAFWFDSQPPARPTLKGKPLIDKARMVLAIPIPVAAWTPANGKATQTDPLDLVPGDFHHRNWSSLSDTELSAWRTRLHGKRSGEVIRNEHGEAKLLGWMQRADAVWDARDAEWSKSDAAGGAK